MMYAPQVMKRFTKTFFEKVAPRQGLCGILFEYMAGPKFMLEASFHASAKHGAAKALNMVRLVEQ
jgi:hypothetical protein